MGVQLLGRSRSIRIDGHDLHWNELGDGPPVVLLHGLTDSHRTWRRIAHELATHYRLYLVDLPGHGLSGRADADYSLKWHTRLVGDWLDALDLHDVALIGHSFGGGVGQYLLLTHHQRISRLGLVAAGGLGRSVPVGLRLLSLSAAERVIWPWMLRFGTWSALGLVGRHIYEPEEAAWLARANGEAGTVKAVARTARSVIGVTGQRISFFDKAHEIDALPPIRLFWGDRDQIVPIRHAERAVRSLDGAKLVRFEGCGHYPHLERPAELVGALRTFIDEDSQHATLVDPKRGALWRMAQMAQLATRRLARRTVS